MLQAYYFQKQQVHIIWFIFHLALSGSHYVLFAILYIDINFVYLSSFEPYLHQYLHSYLVFISGILIRILRIKFTFGLRLLFIPYLIRIWSMQSWHEWKTVCQSISDDPTVSVSYQQYLLRNNLRTFDCKIQLSSFIICIIKLNLLFIKFALLTHIFLLYTNKCYRCEWKFRKEFYWIFYLCLRVFLFLNKRKNKVPPGILPFSFW